MIKPRSKKIKAKTTKELKEKAQVPSKKKGKRYGGRKRTLEDPVQLSTLIDRSDRDWLNTQAAREGISQGLLVRRLIHTYQEHAKSWVSNVPIKESKTVEETAEKSESGAKKAVMARRPRLRKKDRPVLQRKKAKLPAGW